MDMEYDLYEEISKVDADELAAVLDHVLFCYSQKFPQWSVSVISIDKCEDKTEQIDRMIALLEKIKEMPSDLESRHMRM